MRIENLSLPENIISILKENGIEKLNEPQILALKAGLLDGKNVVVASPTASGKTLVAEIAIARNFLNNKKSVYIVPLKALASEKYNEFREKYGKLGMKIAISVGDPDSNEEWLGNYDLIITSNEKMDSLLRHGARWVREISLVVADEIHMLNDVGRGPTLEIVITRLISMANPQIIALSATIRNAEEISDWLSANIVKSNYRPVKLKHGIYYPFELYFTNENHEFPEGDSEIVLCKDTLEKGKQALFFTSTRKGSEALSEKLTKTTSKYLTDGEKKRLSKISNDILHALHSPTRQCKRLAQAAKHGIAFHHAGLVAKQRKLIEDAFRDGTIKMLTATPTLSYGVNLPAWRVFVRDAKRYSGYGSAFIPVLEMQQMFGRAGRPKYDTEGEAVIIAKGKHEARELWERYIDGEPEPIYSKLAIESQLRMHLLALIASEVITSKMQAEEFFSKTFFAHQYGDINEVMKKVDKLLAELKAYKFITIGSSKFIADEFIPAFELGSEELRATRIGKRVSELYIDPQSANAIIKNLAAKNDIEYMLTINSCAEMRPLPRIKESEAENIEDLLISMNLPAPDVWDIDYEDFLEAFRMSLLLHDWIGEIGEDKLLDKYGMAPGELYNKITNAEWLLYSASELALLLNKNDVATRLRKLQLRVKHGVREELLKLIKVKGIGRVRARLLYKNGIKDTLMLRRASDAQLERILGKGVVAQVRHGLKEALDKKMRYVKRKEKYGEA